MTKDEIIKDHKQYIEVVDEMKKGIYRVRSGLSGGPLCTGCNPWLLKCEKEELEKYTQMMRVGDESQFEYKQFLKEKYKNEGNKIQMV
jgi:hypothetical protein